jgi:hypothetical protein
MFVVSTLLPRAALATVGQGTLKIHPELAFPPTDYSSVTPPPLRRVQRVRDADPGLGLRRRRLALDL